MAKSFLSFSPSLLFSISLKSCSRGVVEVFFVDYGEGSLDGAGVMVFSFFRD